MKTNEIRPELRLDFIEGLKESVLAEIAKNKDFRVMRELGESVHVNFSANFARVKSMRSILRAYIVLQNAKLNPYYISQHKSMLGELIEIIIGNRGDDIFKTFKISCAGHDSKEVRSIAEYVAKTFELVEKEDADLKIHITKSDAIWEVGAQITSRPLSLRDYKVANMSGAMDPTIAYAMNSLCDLDKAQSYLNIFSGSATLPIEAALQYPNIQKIIGFDNSKKHLSLAIQNIKKAGLITRIQLREGDIFDKPDYGKFDVIVSDLPFGMSISKNENLSELYRAFIYYCENTLNPGGTLAIYTTEYEIMEDVLKTSKFHTAKKMDLKFVTSVNSYLRPSIYILHF